MQADEYKIGRIIKEHFNWEQYMSFINPQKMILLTDIDSKEKLNQHKNYILQIAGKNYVLTPQIEYLMEGMIYYFNGNADAAESYGLDISKGICVVGKPGIGKTILFELMHQYLTRLYKRCQNDFFTNSTDKLIETMLLDNSNSGSAFVNDKPDGYGSRFKKPQHMLLNELGVKYAIRRWGTDANDIIATILMRRYELFQQHKIVTHATTNEGTKQLENIFHERLVNRFIEIFNMVKLEGPCFRTPK